MPRNSVTTCVFALLALACTPDTEVEATGEVVIEGGIEVVHLTVTGEPGATLTIEGPGQGDPGVEYNCRYPHLVEGGSATITCTYPVGEVPNRSLTYRVHAALRGSMDTLGEATTLVTVERELGLRWVQSEGITLVDGTSGRLWIDASQLVLAGAPEGTTLSYGDLSGTRASDGTIRLPLDLDQMADHIGVGSLFDGSGSIMQLAHVRLGVPDEQVLDDVVTAPTATVRAALVRALSADALMQEPAPVTGSALLIIDADGRPTLHGTARRVSDIAYVAVQWSEERRRGRCGPYGSAFFGNPYYRSYVPRFSPTTRVEIHDRAQARVAGRRTFRGERPTCPQLVENGRTRVVGRGPHPQDVQDWVLERVQRLAGTS